MYAALTAFAVRKFEISLQCLQACQLPAYKGSMWHGWLGRALNQYNPSLYQLLFKEDQQELSRLYALDIGNNESTQAKVGDLLSIGITLFGPAAEQYQAILYALQQGVSLGLGEERASFLWVGHQPLFPLSGQPANLEQWLNQQPITQSEVATLLLKSPLRVKSQGRILRSSEQLASDLIFRQIRRRLKCLAGRLEDGGKELISAINEWPVPCVDWTDVSLQFEDWQRYSLRQQEYLPFGGLKGYLRLQNCPPSGMVWLRIGELLQIGGKTTFGLGSYRVIVSSAY